MSVNEALLYDLAEELAELHDDEALDLSQWETARRFCEEMTGHDPVTGEVVPTDPTTGATICGESFMAGQVCMHPQRRHEGPHV